MDKAWELYFESKLRSVGRRIGKVGGERLTQKQIGGMIGVSQQTISRYYNAVRIERAPTLWHSMFSKSQEKPPVAKATLIRRRTRRIVKL